MLGIYWKNQASGHVRHSLGNLRISRCHEESNGKKSLTGLATEAKYPIICYPPVPIGRQMTVLDDAERTKD